MINQDHGQRKTGEYVSEYLQSDSSPYIKTGRRIDGARSITLYISSLQTRKVRSFELFHSNQFRNGSGIDLHHYSTSESSDTEKLSLEQHLNTILNEIGCESSEEIQNMLVIALEGIGIVCLTDGMMPSSASSQLLRRFVQPCKHPR